jgi:negative regulator of flagellin synthesis FlgM
MKIGHQSDPSLATQVNTSQSPKTVAGARPGVSEKASETRGKSSSAGVSVTVSSAARALEKADRNDGAEVDAQKVASVRAAIQQGTYVVNPEAIADKMLSNAQEMLKRTTS